VLPDLGRLRTLHEVHDERQVFVRTTEGILGPAVPGELFTELKTREGVFDAGARPLQWPGNHRQVRGPRVDVNNPVLRTSRVPGSAGPRPIHPRLLVPRSLGFQRNVIGLDHFVRPEQSVLGAQDVPGDA
jgi:hypothetical protein